MNNIELRNEAVNRGYTPISYSQISLYHNCPLSWKLQYIDKLKKDQKSIHLIFGTAIHNTIQHWLELLYNNTLSDFDINGYFKNQLTNEYMIMSDNGINHFSTAKQLAEFYTDGVGILGAIMNAQKQLYCTKTYTLIGSEIPIIHSLEINPKVAITGFIDNILQHNTTKRYDIRDFKTSTRGWTDELKDFTKAIQLLLYKKYYAKQLGISIDSIDVSFLILKRKTTGERLQHHTPKSDKAAINKMDKIINDFVGNVFDADGKYKTDITFGQATSPKSCQWCQFRETEHCNMYN